jgi:hypothetical protein
MAVSVELIAPASGAMFAKGLQYYWWTVDVIDVRTWGK